MTATAAQRSLEALEALIGEWSMTNSFAGDSGPRARTTFEWLTGRQFLLQRWEVDHPDAPDGLAVIGFDSECGTLLQHYFDSRGVARVYEMTFADGIWTLHRSAAPPDFWQRFTGSLHDDGTTIIGRWEHSSDGDTWEDDFAMTYSRLA